MPNWPLLARIVACSGTIVQLACLDQLGSPDAIPPGGSLATREENLRPGSDGWDVGPYAGGDSTINGYGLPFSLHRGDTLHLFVTARYSPISISVYRLGWYNGAGGRFITSHTGLHVADAVPCSTPVPGPMVCNWPETDRFVVDTRWIPGLYLATFTDSRGRARVFPFVVRSDRPATFIVVLPFATYQAYNPWGGASLYAGPGATPNEAYANRAVQVSFARPYSEWVLQNDFLGVDYLLVRWLEQHAYDVSYITDFDFDLGRGVDPQAVAWLFPGHSEYWSWSMWQRANDGRAEGVSLGFLGGNDIYWVIRFESISVNGLDAPVVVCYRDAARDPEGGTPGRATVLFRSPPNNTPENALVGVMSGPHELMRTFPVDLVVANGSDPLMTGTGLSTGMHIPLVAGWEADRIVDNGATPAGVRTLFQSPYVPMVDSTATEWMYSTVYSWPASGAVVYAAGEPGFAWGLASYGKFVARPSIERLLENVLATFVEARSHH